MTLEEVLQKMAKEKKEVLQLSVVMITIPERKEEFSRLKAKVEFQKKECEKNHPALGLVQIIPIETPKYTKGGPSIGAKRQLGLDKAMGAYVCWLDDDDDIAPDYIETLLRLAYEGGDVLTFSNLSRFENYWCVVRMSLFTTQDDQVQPGIVNRRPYHVCAWKTELAKKVKFPDLNKDEDTGFIEKLIPYCTTEQHSERIIHEYKRTEKSYALEALCS